MPREAGEGSTALAHGPGDPGPGSRRSCSVPSVCLGCRKPLGGTPEGVLVAGRLLLAPDGCVFPQGGAVEGAPGSSAPRRGECGCRGAGVRGAGVRRLVFLLSAAGLPAAPCVCKSHLGLLGDGRKARPLGAPFARPLFVSRFSQASRVRVRVCWRTCPRRCACTCAHRAPMSDDPWTCAGMCTCMSACDCMPTQSTHVSMCVAR